MTSVHTSGLLPAALAHAGQGFSVFPLHPSSKRPVITRWEQHATRGPARIRTWWRHRPNDNIAIACGPSRLHVLDLDTSHHTPSPNTTPTAVEGQQTLARLAAYHNRALPVPTYTVITPSGGMHLYYAAPVVPALRTSCGRLGPHIDSRGHGGYVVAAGSSLPHGRYQVVDDRTPIPLPGWLTQLLTNSPPPAAAPNARNVITHPDAYVRAALTNQAARIRIGCSPRIQPLMGPVPHSLNRSLPRPTAIRQHFGQMTFLSTIFGFHCTIIEELLSAISYRGKWRSVPTKRRRVVRLLSRTRLHNVTRRL
ncbi:bifunctional DNA primase/polymerase [Nocardia cyriacigeorgica]|uniref:bifunctional DNA primase/polymerase n=1 Tax=Nocardia cyriacigeorgica TaxID=135487 RepID=UPI00245784FD|nr:bifunctional DNA primase/polymerase [Nocardia cyriacigeorgica]